jgi:hypothetical protein
MLRERVDSGGWITYDRRMRTRARFAKQPLLVIAGFQLLALCLAGGAVSATAAEQSLPSAGPLPVRGLHLSAPAARDLPALLSFIRETLPVQGVNTLILEFDYGYQFQSRPEFADAAALGKLDVAQIVQACREKGIELIPQMNCLGHQSWDKRTARLLTAHPEFDETPGKYPDNKDIYCRSYCPLHPQVHSVLFALIDELAKDCQAKAFHVGMDEVFILADPDCPRCHGKSTAEVFATEVQTLDEHLKSIGCRMWMWGDRFLDGQATHLGKWEASENGTQSAVDHVPKDIVICDWHYDSAPETLRFFAGKGFDVVACPWRKTDVAFAELAQVRALRRDPDPELARHVLGIVQTTWCGAARFIQASGASASADPSDRNSAAQAAQCFHRLFAEIRKSE